MSEQVLINLVDKATSEYLIQTDWAVNMQLCDTLNNDPSGYVLHSNYKNVITKQ